MSEPERAEIKLDPALLLFAALVAILTIACAIRRDHGRD